MSKPFELRRVKEGYVGIHFSLPGSRAGLCVQWLKLSTYRTWMHEPSRRIYFGSSKKWRGTTVMVMSRGPVSRGLLPGPENPVEPVARET